MQEIGIDIETYSSNDLKSCGVYKYVEAPDFTILLFAYSVDRGPVTCCDFAQGETLPENVVEALRDPGGSNCTLLELKLSAKSCCKFLSSVLIVPYWN